MACNDSMIKGWVCSICGFSWNPLKEGCDNCNLSDYDSFCGAIKEKETKPKTRSEVSHSQLEELYSIYPRKEGKSQGLKIAHAQIKTLEHLGLCRAALENYKAHLIKTNKEAQYIKHFATFMNHWRDWLDRDHGNVEDFSQKQKTMEEIAATIYKD